MNKTITILSFCLYAIGTKAADTLTVSTTPVMHCASCETKIKKHIRFVKGTKKISTNIPTQTITILYDRNKSAAKDYKDAFRKIGYEIKLKDPKEG